jgi:hypothetical protein
MTEKRRHYILSTGKSKGCMLEGQTGVYVLSNMHIPPAEGNFNVARKVGKL